MPMEVDGASTLVYTHAVCFTDIDIYTTLHELNVEIDFYMGGYNRYWYTVCLEIVLVVCLSINEILYIFHFFSCYTVF